MAQQEKSSFDTEWEKELIGKGKIRPELLRFAEVKRNVSRPRQ